MDAIECIKTRRSVRSYTPGEVPREVIEELVDCGRLAASALNAQPCVFVAVTDPETRRQLADVADHGKFIADAGCCIAVFCEKCKYYIEDGSAATQNILLAAHARGLGSCWVAGDKKDYAPRVAELLGVPPTHTLMSLIAIGNAAATPNPTKKSLAEVLRWERF